MATSQPIRGNGYEQPVQGEVIQPRSLAAYERAAPDRLPVRHDMEIRRTLGIIPNGQDVAQENAVTEIVYTGKRADMASQVNMVVEYRNAQRTVQGIEAIEQRVVWKTDPETYSGQFANASLVDAANRTRVFTHNLMLKSQDKLIDNI